MRGGWQSAGRCVEISGSCTESRCNNSPCNNWESFIISATEQQHSFKNALSLLRAGNAEGATLACNEALKKFPGDANFLCLAARALLAQRMFNDAKRHLDDAIRLFPDFAVAHDVFGDVLLAQGYPTAAVNAYEQALRLDPTHPNVLDKIEKAQQLIASAPQVEADGAAPADGKPPEQGRRMAFADEIHKAEQLTRDGDTKQSEDIYRQILKRDPNHVEAARLLARIAAETNRFREAEIFLQHAAKSAPDYGRIWVDLADVYRELDQLDDALECAIKVLALAPEMSESHMLHAGVLGTTGRHEEAIRAYEKALAIVPTKAGAMCSMGHHLKTIGEQDKAIAMYRQCLATKPDHAEAYWSLANLKTFRFDDAEIAAMHGLLDKDELINESRLQIHNALGLDRESRNEYDTAFAHYRSCNDLRRKAETYDPVETETRFGRIMEVFDEELLEKYGAAGSTDDSPIFIVGLPRSGSTLIEQILASHSQIDGTHELGDLPKIIQNMRRDLDKKSAFPDVVPELAADEWAGIGAEYIRSTQRYRAGAPHFIDKNPNNFTNIGLIRLALPNAKIINAIRHPLDSCFGAYKQLFVSGQPFSYDLTELGEYYLQYLRLVDHWHQWAPGLVLDVHYEQVVADLDTQVKRMLEFCKLPFEPECLRFHETDRAVKTASSEQVRRPIYTSSVNLWRNYEHHLGELVEILQPQLQQLPMGDRPGPVTAAGGSDAGG
jgi:tetratricopeptide (TPR) repeat protein